MIPISNTTLSIPLVAGLAGVTTVVFGKPPGSAPVVNVSGGPFVVVHPDTTRCLIVYCVLGNIPAIRKFRLLPGLHGRDRVAVTSAAFAVGQNVTLTFPLLHAGTLNSAISVFVDTVLTTGELVRMREATSYVTLAVPVS